MTTPDRPRPDLVARGALLLLLAGLAAWVGFALVGSQTVEALYAAQAAQFVDGAWQAGGPSPPHATPKALLFAGLLAFAALLCVPFLRRQETPVLAQPGFLAAVLALVLLALASLHWDFVVDDAYITFRYGENLARGHGIVWNVGENPVEGFTSLLAVLWSALAVLLRVSPVVAAKLAAAAAACGVVRILVRRSASLPWGLQLVVAGGAAFSPAFAFHAMHGMETAVACFLVLATAVSCLRLLERPGRAPAAAAFGGAFASFLCRPDTAAFTAVCLAGTAALLLARRERRALSGILGFGAAFGAAWCATMAWRRLHFGFWLPNTFHVKIAGGEGLLERAGADYALGALVGLAGPFVGLLLVVGAGAVRRRIVETLPILAGCLVFGGYLCTIVPLQGFLWRFAFPVFPALLLAVAHAGEGSKLASFLGARRAVSAAVALLFCAWSARQLPTALDLKEERTQHDRVLVGQRLSGTAGTMLVSEAGAVPYYSRWKAADTLGLVSEEIARSGLSVEALERWNPDLVMLSLTGPYVPLRAVHPYMIARGFVPVAAVHKSRAMYHYYFVRSDSPLADAIRAAVLDVPGLRYGNLERLLGGDASSRP